MAVVGFGIMALAVGILICVLLWLWLDEERGD